MLVLVAGAHLYEIKKYWSFTLPMLFAEGVVSRLLIHPRQREGQESWENMMFRAYCINSITLKEKHSGRQKTTRLDLKRS